MHKYAYDGPVMIFDKCVCDRWRAETVAPSEKKARSNLAHQWKLENGLIPQTKVELPKNLTLIG